MLRRVAKRKGAQWVAAGMCAILSLLTISMNLILSVVNRTNVGGWAIVFLCFLPMCFFFVGAAATDMQTQIHELRQQFKILEERSAPL